MQDGMRAFPTLLRLGTKEKLDATGLTVAEKERDHLPPLSCISQTHCSHRYLLFETRVVAGHGSPLAQVYSVWLLGVDI